MPMSSALVELAAAEAQAALFAMRNAIDDAVDEVHPPDSEIVQRANSACEMARQEALAAGVGTRADKAASIIQQRYRAVVHQREGSKQLEIEKALAAFEVLVKTHQFGRHYCVARVVEEASTPEM